MGLLATGKLAVWPEIRSAALLGILASCQFARGQ
jgi:hypothetical protein